MEIRVGTELDLETCSFVWSKEAMKGNTRSRAGEVRRQSAYWTYSLSTAERPVRVELEGDTVESLREFNVVDAAFVQSPRHPGGLSGERTGGGNAASLPDALVVAVNPGLIELA